MKTAIKSALLSGLVFPGLGQISLKHHLRGIILILITLVGLSVIISIAVKGALDVLSGMQGQDSINMSAINSLAAASSTGGSAYYNGALLLVAGCWIFSIIDAYRLGKHQQQ